MTKETTYVAPNQTTQKDIDTVVEILNNECPKLQSRFYAEENAGMFPAYIADSLGSLVSCCWEVNLDNEVRDKTLGVHYLVVSVWHDDPTYGDSLNRIKIDLLSTK